MTFDVLEFEKIKCVVRYPDGYKEGEKYPVILYLHGAGTRGNDLNMLRENLYFSETAKHENFPFISVAPQCCENTWFDLFETLKELSLYIFNKDFTDKEKFYLMGVSMGGYATWQLSMSLPEIFAAIVPICGGGMYWNAPRLVNVPVWAFHGGKDDVVFTEESVKMVDAVNKNGGNARLTIYPENKHDAWLDTYKNIKVFEWLLENVNKNANEIKDDFKGSKIYG